MTFSEALLVCENASIELEMDSRKVNAIVEHAVRECEISRAEAENKVFEESADVADLAVYYEEAEGKKENVVVKAIVHMKDKLIEFLNKIGDFINQKILHRDTDTALKAMGKAPNAGKAKAATADLKAGMASDDKTLGKLKALRMKVRKSGATDKDEKTLKQIMEDFKRDHEKAYKATKVGTIAAITTMLVGAGNMIHKRHGEQLADAKKCKEEFAKAQALKAAHDKSNVYATDVTARKIEAAYDTVVNQSFTDATKSYTAAITACKSAFKPVSVTGIPGAVTVGPMMGKGKKATFISGLGTPATESAEDIYAEVLGDVFEESYDELEESTSYEDQAQAFFDAVATLR